MIKEAFILNYDCGNFSSLKSWLHKGDIPTYLIDVSEEFDQLNEESLLILPGVGHLKTAHDSIVSKEFRNKLDKIRGTVPVLGICLGAQIMFESSAESPDSQGLSWFEGHVKQLPADQCPRLGWYETIQFTNNRKEKIHFYYNHSYFIEEELATLNKFKIHSKSASNILADFIAEGRVMGIQYHPEKSQSNGAKLLKWILANL